MKNFNKVERMYYFLKIQLLVFSTYILFLPSYAYARSGVDELFLSLVVPLIIILVVFIICREIVCWYWKINEALSVLKEIRDLLRKTSSSSSNTIINDKFNEESETRNKIVQVENAPKGPGGSGHHWGKNDKTYNIIKECPKCKGVFHGDEFEVCGECNCLLINLEK